MADPMHQFQVQKIMDLPDFSLPFLGRVDMAVTNATVAMAIAFGLVVLFFTLSTARVAVVPGRMQVVGESVFGFIDDLAVSIIGHEGRKFFPYVFTLFTFILAMNLLGLFLVFGPTAQLAVTATLGVMTIALVIIVGIAKNGLAFFKLFVPSGVPWYLLILVVPIEVISFALRPATLALRLFGNMLGGHVVLSLFGSFVVALAILGLSGGLSTLAFVPSALSFAMIVALTGLELVVAVLQAFVFAALATVYLNEVVNFGHGH